MVIDPDLLSGGRSRSTTASAPDIYVAVSSITMMGLGSVDIAKKKATQDGAPVYLYNFGYKSGATIPGTDYRMGGPHAMDIPFKFLNVPPPGNDEGPGRGFGGGPGAYTASHNMAELWTTFANSGIPAAEGAPELYLD